MKSFFGNEVVVVVVSFISCVIEMFLLSLNCLFCILLNLVEGGWGGGGGGGGGAREM